MMQWNKLQESFVISAYCVFRPWRNPENICVTTAGQSFFWVAQTPEKSMRLRNANIHVPSSVAQAIDQPNFSFD